MRARLSAIALGLAIVLVMPAAALADQGRVYHGTWDSAGWTFDPDTCPFPPAVPASGNWNVTIHPDGRTAVVHITIFSLGLHVDSWGGRSLGDFWTVDSLTDQGFALHLDLTNTPLGSWNTFVLDKGTLTFTIAPWVVGPFSCTAAMSFGRVR